MKNYSASVELDVKKLQERDIVLGEAVGGLNIDVHKIEAVHQEMQRNLITMNQKTIDRQTKWECVQQE